MLENMIQSTSRRRRECDKETEGAKRSHATVKPRSGTGAAVVGGGVWSLGACRVAYLLATTSAELRGRAMGKSQIQAALVGIGATMSQGRRLGGIDEVAFQPVHPWRRTRRPHGEGGWRGEEERAPTFGRFVALSAKSTEGEKVKRCLPIRRGRSHGAPIREQRLECELERDKGVRGRLGLRHRNEARVDLALGGRPDELLEAELLEQDDAEEDPAAPHLERVGSGAREDGEHEGALEPSGRESGWTGVFGGVEEDSWELGEREHSIACDDEHSMHASVRTREYPVPVPSGTMSQRRRLWLLRRHHLVFDPHLAETVNTESRVDLGVMVHRVSNQVSYQQDDERREGRSAIALFEDSSETFLRRSPHTPLAERIQSESFTRRLRTRPPSHQRSLVPPEDAATRTCDRTDARHETAHPRGKGKEVNSLSLLRIHREGAQSSAILLPYDTFDVEAEKSNTELVLAKYAMNTPFTVS
ncbi:hypothetical protein B0H12DRAFT_1080666 [Mycena haematopus]|nr:hypothetical protein B0H12DRAFT_1080666 [Mycena haematopus]